MELRLDPNKGERPDGCVALVDGGGPCGTRDGSQGGSPPLSNGLTSQKISTLSDAICLQHLPAESTL